jgi:hypothetical protein
VKIDRSWFMGPVEETGDDDGLVVQEALARPCRWIVTRRMQCKDSLYAGETVPFLEARKHEVQS